MQVIQTFSELLKLWPSAGALAEDLNSPEAPVKEVTARMWRQRGIPSEYWLGIVAAADKRGIEGVSLDLLAKLSAEQAGRPVPEVAA